MKQNRCFCAVITLLFLSVITFGQTVYVTSHGKKYHTEDCNSLHGHGIAIDLKDAIAQGYTPCKICNPPTLSKEEQAPVTHKASSGNYPCDATLWQHVYHKYRLQVIEECKTVNGVVVSLRQEKDGDYHIRLRLDPGQGTLLNDKNNTAQAGCLVIEIICANNVTQQDAIGACENYINNVPIPSPGQHIKVTGSYVYDSQHGWNEIHPVTEINEL